MGVDFASIFSVFWIYIYSLKKYKLMTKCLLLQKRRIRWWLVVNHGTRLWIYSHSNIKWEDWNKGILDLWITKNENATVSADIGIYMVVMECSQLFLCLSISKLTTKIKIPRKGLEGGFCLGWLCQDR